MTDSSVVPGLSERLCRWCEGPIRRGSRRDAKFCKQRCRQAAHRFVRSAGATAPRNADPSLLATRDASLLQPRRFAYADPPYPGLARRYYADQPDYSGEVDHHELVSRLATFDGWALSTSARALRDVLLLCPPDVQVAAWFRGARHGRSYSPLSAWEPVVYRGARRVVSPTARQDALVYVQRPRLTDPRRIIGAKPAAFSAWLFALLGMQPGDELVDLFPGSGGVTRAWEAFVEASRQPGRQIDDEEESDDA